MPLEPKIPKKPRAFSTKKCAKCEGVFGVDSFSPTHSIFYPDGYLPICNDCIYSWLEEEKFNWAAVDKLCQWAGIPFIVKEWERLSTQNTPETLFPVYAQVFISQDYESIGWDDYYKQYKKLKEVGLIEEEVPLVREEKYVKLRQKWGGNYNDEELSYLEDLYKGLVISQNVNGALQVDQAKKICKLSLEIDSRIRAGDKDVDKLLGSYDKLVKTAEFTPKNTKNATDFDSIAELGYWLEKRGFINKFYDGTTRDVLDETLKNIQNYNQRLYINEGGIGEEITERIKSLKSVQEMEDYYDTQKEYNLEDYDNEGYEVEDTEFNPAGDDEDE